MMHPIAPSLPPHSDGIHLSLSELLYYRSQVVRWLPPAKPIWSQMSGSHTSRAKGRGMEFMEVRRYQAGDDIRNIDWRVTARTRKAHTKLFAEDKEHTVLLYLDFSDSLFFGSQYVFKSVQLAHLASILIWQTLAKKDRIGVIIDDGQQCLEFPPAGQQSHVLRILNAIVTVHNHCLERAKNNASRCYSYQQAIDKIYHLSPKGSEIILMSDFSQMDDTAVAALGQFKLHNFVRVVQCFDPIDKGQTSFRGLGHVTDGFNHQWINFRSKKQRENLQHYFSQRQDHLKQLCHSMGLAFHSFSSGQPLLRQLS